MKTNDLDSGDVKSSRQFRVGGKDACVGDSGGPLWKWFGTKRRTAFIVGVVSRGRLRPGWNENVSWTPPIRFSSSGSFQDVGSFHAWSQTAATGVAVGNVSDVVVSETSIASSHSSQGVAA